MKKLFFLAALLVSAVACDIEYVSYPEPAEYDKVSMEPNTTIAELKSLYTKPGAPVYVREDLVIGGRVISSDASGNIYRSLYIEDETGAIEIKIGKSSTCLDYQMGQWIYVRCKGLTLGAYGGMVQLGYECESGDYETSYLDVKYLIDAHIFRGRIDSDLQPTVISAADIKNQRYWGCYVTVNNLVYSNKIFCILYDDSKPTSSAIYLSDKTYGVNTWAMSENGFKTFMTPNGKAEPQSAFEGAVSADVWQSYYNAASAYNVSQYFTVDKQDLQVRTSGYAKFADSVIDKRILNGSKVSMTGILTYYNGNYQFVLNDLEGVVISE